MAVYWIPDEPLLFPHPLETDPSGILAVGGDLRPARLLLAYQFGIFPWYSEGEPIYWWYPNPRCVLYPDKLKIAKSMRSYINREKFTVTSDLCFQEVVLRCQQINRKGQSGTWITDEMVHAYTQLHHMGVAHSIEVWDARELVGGLYGISIGKVFFGESMFSHRPNASKFGFIHLVRALRQQGFEIIDCQQETDHMKRLGAELIPAAHFAKLLRRNVFEPAHLGPWTTWFSTHFRP